MRLSAETWLSAPRHEVFPFFADAANLQSLTPPWLHFSIRSALPIAMYPGREIEYTIRLRGIPMRWASRIAAFEPPSMFVDEQLRGPYRRWVHTHRFIETRGGTTILDEVEFDMLGGWLVGGLVARDLRKIFTFRHQTLLELFKQPAPWTPARISISR